MEDTKLAFTDWCLHYLMWCVFFCTCICQEPESPPVAAKTAPITMPVYNPAAHQPAMADPTYGNYNQQYTGAGQQQYNYHGQPPSTQQYAPPASQPSPKQQVVTSP